MANTVNEKHVQHMMGRLDVLPSNVQLTVFLYSDCPYFTIKFCTMTMGTLFLTNYFIVACLIHCTNSWEKMFSRSSQQPIRTVTTGYAVSSMFVPGDKQAIIGTKVQLCVQRERWNVYCQCHQPGLSLSCNSQVALIFTPVANLLPFDWIVSTVGTFSHSI